MGSVLLALVVDASDEIRARNATEKWNGERGAQLSRSAKPLTQLYRSVSKVKTKFIQFTF